MSVVWRWWNRIPLLFPLLGPVADWSEWRVCPSRSIYDSDPTKYTIKPSLITVCGGSLTTTVFAVAVSNPHHHPNGSILLQMEIRIMGFVLQCLYNGQTLRFPLFYRHFRQSAFHSMEHLWDQSTQDEIVRGWLLQYQDHLGFRLYRRELVEYGVISSLVSIFDIRSNATQSCNQNLFPKVFST